MSSRASRVLIVDDEPAIRELLARFLRKEGYDTVPASDGEEALAVVKAESVDVVLLDIQMPRLDGIETLQRIKKLDRDLPVIMATCDGRVSQVVTAMRAGAYDYVVKPFAHPEVIRSVHKAIIDRRLRRSIHHLSGRTQEAASLQEQMGTSEVIERIVADVMRVAHSDFAVLLLGETGTGKELVARAIHEASARAGGPFVAVDCGAIPETLFESELFGHEKGSFTGADRSHPGKFEAAARGTLLLDEIGNMPLGSQSKLLRALQERNVCRVGATTPVKVECRVVAASNEDLETAAARGTFRKDLFFRLSEFVIRIPPLRKHTQDILFLAKRFIDLTNRELGKSVQGLSEQAVARLLEYDWPGNVRHLRSTIRRAVLLADAVIEEEHLGLALLANAPLFSIIDAHHVNEGKDVVPLKELVHRSTVTVERTAIMLALQQAKGNKAQAARLLQIDYKTIHSKLKRYGSSPSGERYDEEKD